MQAYDDDCPLSEESQDAFGASRAAFDALTATLGSAEASCWAHDQIEDHLEAHAFMQNVRSGHYELAVEAPIGVRVAVAFGELAAAI